MGAEPRWLLVALCAPADLDDDVVDGLYGGLGEAGALYGTRGDRRRHRPRAKRARDRRHGDRRAGRRTDAALVRPTAGDVLAVTGPLGRAAAGVNLLLSQDPKKVVPERRAWRASTRTVVRSRASPRDGGSRRAGVRAAIDVSDGLGVRRAAARRGVRRRRRDRRGAAARRDGGAQRRRGSRLGRRRQMVLGGGEDLELLVAAPPALVEAARAASRSDASSTATACGSSTRRRAHRARPPGLGPLHGEPDEGRARADDRRLRLRRRSRHPGRPQDVRDARRPRDVGAHGADRAEHRRRPGRASRCRRTSSGSRSSPS